MRDIVLVCILHESSYRKSIISIVKKLTEKNSGIYVGINKDQETIEKEIEVNDININRMLFINSQIESENFVQTVWSMTGLSLNITNAVNKGNYDFIIMNLFGFSTSYMNVFMNFMSYITNKATALNIKLVIIVDNNSKNLARKLSPLCDKVINM